MSNFAAQLKTEISRIAKKESRAQSADLKKAQATHRAEIADLKRRIASLEGHGAPPGQNTRTPYRARQGRS